MEESGYIKRAGAEKTKAGFEASIYELTTRAYPAIVLNSVSPEELFTQLGETIANEILAGIMHIFGFQRAL